MLGNESAAVEVSAYFCHLSFQGPDWQLFLELESHSLLNQMSGEKRSAMWGGAGAGGKNMPAQLHMRHACEHPQICMLNVEAPSHPHSLKVAKNGHTNVM